MSRGIGERWYWRTCVFLPAIEMASNPVTDDIRYTEGLTCMNKGMYEAAIELFCSLAEE